MDDLLAVVREFICPDVSRSGLDRCLRRHGVSNLRALQPQGPKAKHGTFAVYEPGDLHIDVKYLPQMADENRRRYLFVAIERATRWVFIQVKSHKSAPAARAFLAALAKACPVRIHTILTDNGKEFTDRFVTTGERTPTGEHAFDALCDALGIEHRLTRPRRPQTNGMVERFNGCIEEVLRSHHFLVGRLCTTQPCLHWGGQCVEQQSFPTAEHKVPLSEYQNNRALKMARRRSVRRARSSWYNSHPNGRFKLANKRGSKRCGR